MLKFPGLTNPYSGTGVILRGPAPSRILGLAAQQPTVDVGYGDVELHSNGQSYTFRNAASVSYHVRQGLRRRGESCLSVSYEDRRWKWRYATVSGSFNERLPDCRIKYSSLHPLYRRSARELFRFVLASAGDAGANVNDVPDNIYPRCSWRDVPCDAALDYLCAACRCTIVLDANDQLSVVREASGQSLPAGLITHSRTRVRIGAVPDAVAVGCGPTLFQSKLKLEAVGLDLDNKIKTLDNLSYKPEAGWSDQWPAAFPDVAEDYRYLAYRTVWRWYRIKEQATGGLTIPGESTVVNSTDQYQLTPWLAQTAEDPDGMRRPVPAYIQGAYYPQHDFSVNTQSDAHLPAPFQIIPELNIVEFAYPVWYTVDGAYYEPELYLTTGYHLKKADGSGWARHIRRLACTHPQAGTKDFVIPHPELWKTLIVEDGSDNLSLIDPEITTYLSLHQAVYDNRTATDASYSGVADPALDGKREQAVIECGVEQMPITRIGEMIEHDVWTDDRNHR